MNRLVYILIFFIFFGCNSQEDKKNEIETVIKERQMKLKISKMGLSSLINHLDNYKDFSEKTKKEMRWDSLDNARKKQQEYVIDLEKEVDSLETLLNSISNGDKN